MPRYANVSFKTAMATTATASASVNHTAVSVLGANAIIALVSIATISGATHSMQVKFQTKINNSWFDLPTGGTQPQRFNSGALSAVGAKVIRMSQPFGSDVRAVTVMGAASHSRHSVYGLVLWDA